MTTGAPAVKGELVVLTLDSSCRRGRRLSPTPVLSWCYRDGRHIRLCVCLPTPSVTHTHTHTVQQQSRGKQVQSLRVCVCVCVWPVCNVHTSCLQDSCCCWSHRPGFLFIYIVTSHHMTPSVDITFSRGCKRATSHNAPVVSNSKEVVFKVLF